MSAADGRNGAELDILVAVSVTFFVTAIIPALWLAFRKQSLDKYVQRWVPVAMIASAEAGVAVGFGSLGIKLILGGVLGAIALVGAIAGYPLYLRLKRSLDRSSNRDDSR